MAEFGRSKLDATKVPTNIRELEGALTGVAACDVTDLKPGVELLNVMADRMQ